MELGKRLRQFRRSKEMTQEELGERTGINSVTISRLESGKSPHVEWETVVRLARGLEVSLDVLAGEAPDVPALRPWLAHAAPPQ